MSNIVCQTCRRLVRRSNIHYHEGDYFCANCQTSYKLPASYYKRGEFNIPILAKNSDLKVIKTEEELSIELPMHIFTVGFKIATAFSVFMFFIFLPIYLNAEEKQFPIILVMIVCVYLLTLVNAMAKHTICIKENTINFSKKILAYKMDDINEFKKVKRIREIEVESNSLLGGFAPYKFVEVYFSKDNSWEFGHNLNKADREYVVAELKFFHLCNQVE